MKKSVYVLIAVILFVNSLSAQQTKSSASPASDTASKESKKPSIQDKVKSSHKYEGLFTLYQDTVTGSLQMYVRKDQLGKNFIYQSFSMGGPTSLFLNQNMIRMTLLFKIKKTFDKIEFLEQNTNFYYDPNSAVSKAANVDVAASV